MKYLVWGMSADENFGVESLVSGAYHLIRYIDNEASIVYSQAKQPTTQVMQGLKI